MKIFPWWKKYQRIVRSSRPDMFCKRGVLTNFAKFTGKHLCQSLFFNKVAGRTLFLKNLAQVFSCQFCEIRKNTFSTEHLWWMFLKCYEQGAYLGPCQAFRCSFLAKTVNRYKPFAIFASKLHHRCLAKSDSLRESPKKTLS